MLSITSDYLKDTGCPQPYLQHIAEAGFSHIHWCHQWTTDFIYSRPEIEQIARWLAEYGLHILNLHASAGVEKNWNSPREYERLAGIELVANRLQMTAELGADVAILHMQRQPLDPAEIATYWDRLHHSLDALEPEARRLGVRLALENYDDDSYLEVQRLFSEYSPAFLGFCYDCGHGNMGRGEGLDQLERVKDRLIAVHLHDNDGTGDQHRVPFKGTVDWPRLAQIIARSSYHGMVNLEVITDYPDFDNETAFLAAAFAAGTRFSEMVDQARQGG
jgi:sugar phosphate isomerase/epimerase